MIYKENSSLLLKFRITITTNLTESSIMVRDVIVSPAGRILVILLNAMFIVHVPIIYHLV